MNKLKKTFSLRKKKELSNDEEEGSSDDWQEDELRVRNGTCQFLLQYLGCVEVQDSKGIHICEEAIKKLIQKANGEYKTLIFQVKGEYLKGIDEATSELVIDQAVEKVAFCSPDRNNEKGFAYISRDSVAKKWMCHGFLTIKDAGERVSYAVGHAFNVCMELRLAKEKLADMAEGREFKRSPSFKFASITDRRCDPQVSRVAEPIPGTKRSETTNFTSIKRPKPPPELLKRQSSFVSTSDNPHEGAFKRQLSLKVEELSAILDQLNAHDPKITKNKLKKDSRHLDDDDEAFLDANNNENVQDIKNLTPLQQDNPWSSSSKTTTTTSSTSNKNEHNTTIDPDDWLKIVAKKAALLGNQPDVRNRQKYHVTPQMRTQSVDFAAINSKLEHQKKLKGAINANLNQSQDVTTSNDDPFDVAWAEGLANKGRNPFKMSNRAASITGGKY